MATINDFMKLDIRVGTILAAKAFEKARKPAYQLEIDFGAEIGVKNSSAQITELYDPSDLTGKKVVAVVNFPPRRIADFISDVLVLGAYNEDGVILLIPDRQAKNGDRIG